MLVLAGGGLYAWRQLEAPGLPPGIASGNGRIEAVEIDVAAKTAGRIAEILVDEGDFVAAGQVLARMDTAQLEAQQRQAEAELARATIGVGTAESLVAQREAERMAASAVVAQREAELDAAQKRLARSERLAHTDTVSRQVLDDDRAGAQAARAAVGAARAQLAAADAAIGAARAQVVDAAHAALDRIAVEITDSTLQSPRDGRFNTASPSRVKCCRPAAAC